MCYVFLVLLCSIFVLSSLRGMREELVAFVFLMPCNCYYYVALPHVAVSWCMIVVFPDHTHLLCLHVGLSCKPTIYVS